MADTMGELNTLPDVERKIYREMVELLRKREKYPPPSSKKILHYLTSHRWEKKMEIRDATGLSYSRVYENMELLEKDGLVKSKQVETSKRGDPVKAYSLTSLGLHRLLFIQPKFWEGEKLKPPLTNLDKIIDVYKDLFPPPITDNWDLIKEKGLDDFIHAALETPDHLGRTILLESLTLLPLIREDLSIPSEDKSGAYEKWLKFVRENDELREWTLEHLEAEQRRRARSLEKVKKAIKQVSSSQKEREMEEGGEKRE